MTSCVKEDRIVEYAAGLLPSEQASSVEQHLRECQRCSKVFGGLASTTRRLAADPAEFDDPSLVDEVMTLVRLGRVRPEATRRPLFLPHRRWLWVAIASSVAALFLVGGLWLRKEPRDEDIGFQVRGGVHPSTNQLVAVRVFRSTQAGYRPIKECIHPKDALAFTYENHLAEDVSFLMIFAVDERGRVFWYYPAYQHEGENPFSRRIVSALEPKALPEAVQHNLEPGRLRIFAVFSRQALEVRAIESKIADQLGEVKSLDQLTRLDIEEARQHSWMLWVRQGSACRGR